jgi:protein-disulfide isomerase
MDKFKAALDQGTYKQAVDDELALGTDVFVEGTPTMFINGARVANATDATSIAAELDKALAG